MNTCPRCLKTLDDCTVSWCGSLDHLTGQDTAPTPGLAESMAALDLVVEQMEHEPRVSERLKALALSAAMAADVEEEPPTDGWAAQRRGESSERRALALAQTITEPWFLGARPCTAAEDHQGVDLVITTDLGDIHIQVKSSEGGAQKFRKHATPRQNRQTLILIVGDRSDEEVLQDLLTGLRWHRTARIDWWV